ncbi:MULTISPECIES: glutathione S-transferase family protein [unclassified Bradyrhizobium]|uniref:glutathione S-transferase family protein n=1 Tax=unclassified Bradyrhizobium TaxID=2631580 RepID=UPI002342B8FF|nr:MULTISPECIES: glutathione S-transferase family protein [unclassified Bradyrhizobium]GLH82876.1 glutathione S-transferase [Bradyrhizobium sp. SSBR45R]
MSADNRLTIWGRPNSVNVQKVLWCLAELDIAYERIDAGMQFGRNTEPDYLAMNPNGRIPTLVDGDFVLWESNAIMRYLCLAYGSATPLYPAMPQRRAAIERWLDWTLSTVQPTERPLFWGLVRTPPEQRDMAALQKAADDAAAMWRILDTHLGTRSYLEAESFTLADIALGAYARRWFGVEGVVKPELPSLARWYRDIARRPAFIRHIAPPLS